MTHEPLWGWLFISLGQTFILLPLLIRRFDEGPLRMDLFVRRFGRDAGRRAPRKNASRAGMEPLELAGTARF